MMKQCANTPLLLGQSDQARALFRQEIQGTVDAILSSFSDERAFSGIHPDELRAKIHIDTLLPEEGVGFDGMLEDARSRIFPYFLRTWSPDYMAHLHSPALIETIASELVIAAFNQSMDSWDQSPVATEVEVEVIRHLLSLYHMGKEGDGVFTSGGSQSNLSAITSARDWYCNEALHHDVKKKGLPSSYNRFRLYTSELSHFSMEKSCHLLGLGYDAVVKVPVDRECRMDISALALLLAKDKAEGNLPFCIVATIGTTDFGSIDDITALKALADEYGTWLHADAAYGSGLAVSSYAKRMGDTSLVDSITVDFHKMFLLPISCSCVLVRDKHTLDCFELHADYLNREEDEEDGYINLVGKSLQTTRRADALKVWFAFRTRGKDGFARIIDTAVENAAYLYERLSKDEDYEVAIKPEISSLVFRLKGSDEKNKQIRRTLIHDKGIVIGQTVYQGRTYLKFTLLNPTLTHAVLDQITALIKTL